MSDAAARAGFRKFGLKVRVIDADGQRVVTRRQRLIFGGSADGARCGTATVAVADVRASDWQPIELVFLLLLVLAVGSDLLTMDWRGFRISGAFLALVLAMALLGPAPAAAIGVVAALVDMVRLPPAAGTRP